MKRPRRGFAVVSLDPLRATILSLVTQGLSDAEIARRVSCSKSGARHVRVKAGLASPYVTRRQHTSDALTPRESEVARCIGQGLEIKEIARELQIGYHTTKMHICHLKQKMGVRNQLEVAILMHGGVPRSLQGDAA